MVRPKIFALVLFFSLGLKATTLQMIRKIPHTGYSEGLAYYKGFLWHALPTQILKISPKDGSIAETFVPASKYSESIIWANGKLWNVSYSDNGFYAGPLQGKRFEFKRMGSVPEDHAWGLEFDGKHFIVTGNYSDKLYFLNPSSLKVERTVTTPVKDLEDLAWDGKGIWTSSFSLHKGKIFRVNPKDGTVSPFFSLPDPSECPIIDGIAYDGKKLWVTGKHCPSIYLFKIPEERQLSQQIAK